MHVRWYSKLYYAGIANAMPNKQLRHPQKPDKRYKYPIRNTSWKTGEKLKDKTATKGFFEIIRNRLKQHIRRVLIPDFFRYLFDNSPEIQMFEELIRVEQRAVGTSYMGSTGVKRDLIQDYKNQIKLYKSEIKKSFKITGLGKGRF
jgi:hypothetical protein